jgi:glycosyltransferase involved in cell wall biosynthesis
VVAESAQVHLHHGNSSIRAIAERYPSAEPLIARTCPHGGYWQLVGTLSPEAARDRLGLSGKGRILLAFGDVRDPRELFLIVQATRARGWHVLFAGRLHSRRKPLWFLINRLARLIPTKRWTLIPGSVPDDEVDAYVKAADAVFIPRYEALNSGNVFLGFTFGKAVVGPSIGNIGEILALTGNPTFDPGDGRSIRRALATLNPEGAAELGRRNAAWLRENGQWDQTAAIARGAIEEGIRRLRKQPGISGLGGASAAREAGA